MKGGGNIRYSVFQNIGKGEVYKFDANYNETGKVEYSRGKIYKTQDGIEPRLGILYSIDPVSSVKASYSRTIQYMQLASNSTGGMLIDSGRKSTMSTNMTLTSSTL